MSSLPITVPCFKCLFGTTPGLLDPTQPDRVLRGREWKLSFAILDPQPLGIAASTEADGLRRVAIEEPPAGAGAPRCRLVPNAELATGVGDEGKSWPRTVNICGEVVVCSVEQWYIYKLDPRYRCYVPCLPYPPIISLREPDPRNDNGKCRVSEVTGDLERLAKRFRTTLSFSEEDSTESGAPSASRPHSGAPPVSAAEVTNIAMGDSANQQVPANDEPESTSGPASPPHCDDIPDTDVEMAMSDVHDDVLSDSNHDTEGHPVPNATHGTATFDPPSTPTADPDTVYASAVDSGRGHGDAGHGSIAEEYSMEVPPPYSSGSRARTEVREETGTPAQGHAHRSEGEPVEASSGNVPNAWSSTGEPVSEGTSTTPVADPDQPIPASMQPEVIDLTMDDDTLPPQYRGKRKDIGEGDQLQDHGDQHSPKRHRTGREEVKRSPADQRAAERAAQRRSTRLTNRLRRQEEMRDERWRREERLWKETVAEAHAASSNPAEPQQGPSASSTSSTSNGSTSSTSGTSASSTSGTSSTSQLPETNEDTERIATIEASRKKLAELEKDKPLWEAGEARREAQAKAERRKEEEAKERHRGEEKEKEKERLRAEEEHRNAAQAAAKAKSAARIQELQALGQQERMGWYQHYARREWSSQIAVQHYVDAGKAFDSAVFDRKTPATFEKIPWPTLLPPWEVTDDQVDWHGVEQFFVKARARLPPNKFKQVLETSVVRFHPDRWGSRNLVKSLGHKATEERLRTVVNIVSQAISDVWDLVKKK